MPVRRQRQDFFFDAVNSILSQTDPNWRLLILLSSDSADESGWARSIEDARVRSAVEEEPGLGGALNQGLSEADTEFVSILLSDDRYAPDAIATLQQRRGDDPQADFFHTDRLYVDETGRPLAPARVHDAPVTREYFLRYGSPVKHLLCWRRAKALEIGGMDVSLSAHGCDDYDFPWRMLEAGARFHRIQRPLYEYRRHTLGARLTTDVALDDQIAHLERMFRKHQASEPEICRYLQRAAEGYLVHSHDELPDDQEAPKACYLEGACGQVFRLPHPDGEPLRRVAIRPEAAPGAAPSWEQSATAVDVRLEADSLRVIGPVEPSTREAVVEALRDYAADLGCTALHLPERVEVDRTQAVAKKRLCRLPADADPLLARTSWL